MAKKQIKLVRATGTRLLAEHIESLPVPLSDAEQLSRAVSLVRLRDEERKVTAEFESHKNAHKNAIAKIDEERERLEQAVREKREKRPVKVESWAHYDNGSFREIRSDTGEVLNERALLATEMQEELDLDAPRGDA